MYRRNGNFCLLREKRFYDLSCGSGPDKVPQLLDHHYIILFTAVGIICRNAYLTEIYTLSKRIFANGNHWAAPRVFCALFRPRFQRKDYLWDYCRIRT